MVKTGQKAMLNTEIVNAACWHLWMCAQAPAQEARKSAFDAEPEQWKK